MNAHEYDQAAGELRAVADRLQAHGDVAGAKSAREFAQHHARMAGARRLQAEARQRLREFGRQLRRDQAVRDARARIGR